MIRRGRDKLEDKYNVKAIVDLSLEIDFKNIDMTSPEAIEFLITEAMKEIDCNITLLKTRRFLLEEF